MVATRTQEAMDEARADTLTNCVLPGPNVPDDAEDQLLERNETRAGKMSQVEVAAHAFIVMLKLCLEATINKVSRLDIAWYFMSVPIVDIAAFYLLQLICLAVLYIRTPADAIKFLDEHPEADMRNIHSTGTYLIRVLLLNAMNEPYRMKWYVGETSEQTLAERARQHEEEAGKMKEGKLATLLTHGQQALYPPGDNVRRE